MSQSSFRVPKGLINISLIVILMWGISEASPFLIPISIAALLAFTMAPLMKIMRRYHFPEWSAITASAVLLVLPFLSLLSIGVWQGQLLIRDFPHIVDALNIALVDFVESDLGHKLHLASDMDLDILLQKLEVSASQGIQFAISSLGTILNAGSQLALVLLFAVLMLASREHIHKCMTRILNENMQIESSLILEDVVALIEKFLIARLLIVLIVGSVDTFILAACKIDYPLLMGGFLGVMTLIPAIGFILGVIPPVLVSFAIRHSIWATVVMFLALFVVSIIEGNVLTPKMVGKRLNINALTTFIGLFGGGLLWGIWGMFLSIPILGVLRIVFYAIPNLQPWGELLAENSERSLRIKVRRKKNQSKVA